MTSPLTRAVLLATLATIGCKSDNRFESLVEYHEELENDHGKWLSMDTAPDGRVAVAYYDATQGALGFALGDETKVGDALWWEYEQVDGYPDSGGLDSGDRGEYASMKVVDDGTVWVAYRDVGNKTLRAAIRVGGIWESMLADAGTGAAPDAGHFASLALNADGLPVVAHQEAGKGVLRVTRYDGSAWSAETVWEGEAYGESDAEDYRAANVGKYARIHIHDGVEYIAFYNAAQQRLELLEGFAGAYTHSVVYDGSDAGAWPSIWTDGAELIIAFQDIENQDLVVAKRAGSEFTVEIADAGEFVGSDTEIFFKGGVLNVLYFDGHENDMKHAVQGSDGVWKLDALAGEGKAVGFHNEIVKNGAGNWWAASYDYTNKKIFAKKL